MNARRVAAIFGFLGVAFGAFGAHAFGSGLSADGRSWWNTATVYLLVHAAAMLGSGHADGRASAATLWFAGGATLFSGSLYALAMTEIRAMGAVTPVGGIALLVGWVMLFRRKD